MCVVYTLLFKKLWLLCHLMGANELQGHTLQDVQELLINAKPMSKWTFYKAEKNDFTDFTHVIVTLMFVNE